MNKFSRIYMIKAFGKATINLPLGGTSFANTSKNPEQFLRKIFKAIGIVYYMKIKDWPAWLKGGVIGVSIGFLFLMLYHLQMTFFLIRDNIILFFLMTAFISVPSIIIQTTFLVPVIETIRPDTCSSFFYLYDCGMFHLPFLIVTGITVLLGYFLLGSLIGWINGKPKKLTIK